jgi:hypothetical protein
MTRLLILFSLFAVMADIAILAEEPAKKPAAASTKLDDQSIDFGAKMLDRLVDAGFSKDQKSKAIAVLKNSRPAIGEICEKLKATIEKTDSGKLSKEAAIKQLAEIKNELAKTNKNIERSLLKIASNDQIVQLKKRKFEEAAKEALVNAKNEPKGGE